MSLFERPFEETKCGVLIFEISPIILEILKIFVQKLMTSSVIPKGKQITKWRISSEILRQSVLFKLGTSNVHQSMHKMKPIAQLP